MRPNIISSLLAQVQPPADATRVAKTPIPLGALKSSIIAAKPTQKEVVVEKPHPLPPDPMLLKDADKDMMVKLIKAAKQKGVDPYTAVAIGLQETGIRNTIHSNFGVNPLHMNTMEDRFSGNAVERSLEFLKEKFEYAKKLGKTDEADVLQAWNGYGKISTDTDTEALTKFVEDWERQNNKNFPVEELELLEKKFRKEKGKMYGIEYTRDKPLDFNDNPVYGKRVIDIRENVIKKSPEMVSLINSIQ